MYWNWNVEQFMKVQLEALFNRVHLQDWRLILFGLWKKIQILVADPKVANQDLRKILVY